MFFLRTGQRRSPGANAIVAALALLIVANPNLDVMAQDDTSSTLPIIGGPDADGCIPGMLR